MNAQTPSYWLGWGRASGDTENTLTGAIDYHAPGKHGYDSNERTYGDPDKEIFLRLAAAIRSYIADDFLVTGEIRKPGFSVTSNFVETAFSYNHYGARAVGSICQNSGDDRDYEHSGTFSDGITNRLVKASWQNWNGIGQDPDEVLHVVANLTSSSQTVTVVMEDISEFTGTDKYSVLILNPSTEDILSTVPFINSAVFSPPQSTTITIPKHGVALLKICDSALTDCTF